MNTSRLGAAVGAIRPGLPLRAYPALVSTEAEAQAWARQGAAHGALVVADYQVSPRGRTGREWEVPPEGVSFSMIFRRSMLAHEQGRLYLAATAALSETDGQIRWPDTVVRDGGIASAVTVHPEEEALHLAWAVLTLLIADAGGRPGFAIIDVVDHIEAHITRPPEELAELCASRSDVIGQRVVAHLLPMGPAGRQITGRATGIDRHGSLLVTTERGTAPVRAQDVGDVEAG